METATVLTRILHRKREEVQERKRITPLSQLERNIVDNTTRGFLQALQKQTRRNKVAVIAEIKRASPSKGIIREHFDPVSIAKSYARAGATCLSVLTDVDFFQGSNQYLQDTHAACSLPILRKDFIVDPYQIFEAKAIGADAVLLIVAALSAQSLRSLYRQALQLGLDVLVEVHNEQELQRALDIDVAMIGINNRDLRNFEVDIKTTLELMKQVPTGCFLITESGIVTQEDVEQLFSQGVMAFLVGEAFMRAVEPGQALKALFSGKL